MNERLSFARDDIINSWDQRAQAYDALIRRWPIFNEMAMRLLDYMSSDFDGQAIDVAGGSGLVAQHLLKRFPKARVTLVEPAENMRILAAHRLGDRIKICNTTSDQLVTLGCSADAALCSASFHLLDEQTTLASIAAVLKPGAIFASNLWGHSFDETVAFDRKADWMQFVDQALGEFGQPTKPRPNLPKKNIKSKDGLKKVGKKCGLRLFDVKIFTAEIATSFNIEFAAMNPFFLNQLSLNIRNKVIERAIELCHSVDTITSVDLVFKKI